MEHKIYKVVEREGKVLGLPFADFGFIALLFLVFFIGGGVAGMFFRVSKYYYLIAVLIVASLYILLRIANGKKHPSYLFSLLSAKYLQPKHIWIKEPAENRLNNESDSRDF
ncbi:hypothetical protein [Mucilaginibacter sp. UYCu711]|uniref:hypothetical protein n=1 Tax=Mucilaginibacter sp. UYCu711 TaxID=3156339 RepID=UPI003D24833A